ncbi:MAG: BMP family protein [Spirochaetaceae bacterium]
MVRKAGIIALSTVMLCVVALGAFAGGQGEGEAAGEEQPLRMAAIFPGSIQDADYNSIGYMALQEVGQEYDVETAYSEKVAVPDAERVLREYANAGFDVIFVHGNQFNGAATNVGPNYPDVTFILEVDSEPTDKLENFWYMDRNFYTGFYVLGALAGLKTETGTVGYLGGLELPFTRAEINSILQALEDVDSDAELRYIYIGDFNDPVKTRQAAEGLISNDVDVIISSVNLGNYGLYNAVQEADRDVFITTKYTDKEVQAPEKYLTSDLFDFRIPLKEVVGRIIDGEKGGFTFLEYGEGNARWTQFPIKNVSDELNDRIRQIAEDVAAGEIEIERNQAEIMEQ